MIKYVKSCKECQQWTQICYEESLYPIWSIIVWEKIGVDVIHMPNSVGYGYIIFTQDNLSEWVEG